MYNDSDKKAKTSFIPDIFLSTYKRMLSVGLSLSVKKKQKRNIL